MNRHSQVKPALLAGAAILTLVAACGQAFDTSGSDTASPARTTSPSPSTSATTPPDPARLTASKCSAPAAPTQPRSLGGYLSINPAVGWADTSNYTHTESLLVELTAPTSDGYAPTRIQFHSVPGPVHLVYGSDATAHAIASQHAATHWGSSQESMASSVADCSVGGAAAGVFGYSDGSDVGFRLSIVHKDGLFEIWLFGLGGVSDQAVGDALAMIGSVTWS
jgi:hypothetical protein